MQTYWSLKSIAEQGRAKRINLPESDIISDLEGHIEKSVTQRMISDVPLGAFLSGGIDSSTVVALMQKNANKPVKTFSIGFEEDGYDEAVHAKQIAKHLGTDHQEFYVSGLEALDVIPILPDIYDEPFSDSSQIPTYLISKLARDKVTVVLTGDGGDEILAGYDRHTKIAALWSSVGWMPQAMRKATFRALSNLPDGLYGKNKGRKVKRAMDLMGLKDAEHIYDRLLSSWPQNIVRQGQEPLIPLKDEKYWPVDLDFVESMIFGDQLAYRPNDLMVKTDRASMAVALEARAPLMDHHLTEYCWSLPHDIKVRGGKGKWALRQILKNYVPETMYERPKQGFSIPLNEWLQGPLKEWGSDLLSKDALDKHGLLENDIIHREWNNFQDNKGVQDVPKHLWSVLMFQAWHERWMG
jgi:asparagine synthase (glutamine-hydrolysing)